MSDVVDFCSVAGAGFGDMGENLVLHFQGFVLGEVEALLLVPEWVEEHFSRFGVCKFGVMLAFDLWHRSIIKVCYKLVETSTYGINSGSAAVFSSYNGIVGSDYGVEFRLCNTSFSACCM